MSERAPISARIIPWNERLGVAYQYARGKHQAHPIGDDHWPILRGLQSAGKLAYTNDDVKERFARQAAVG